MSEMDVISELEAWAKDDLVPGDLQELCIKAASIIGDMPCQLIQ